MKKSIVVARSPCNRYRRGSKPRKVLPVHIIKKHIGYQRGKAVREELIRIYTEENDLLEEELSE